MPTNEVPKKESTKDQPAAAELETKSEELKPEDAAKVTGGVVAGMAWRRPTFARIDPKEPRMPTNEVPKKESTKDQPAAAELETKSEELKPEDAAEVAGGHQFHIGSA
jgi:hypothetical protein